MSSLNEFAPPIIVLRIRFDMCEGNFPAAPTADDSVAVPVNVSVSLDLPAVHRVYEPLSVNLGEDIMGCKYLTPEALTLKL
jgi:hypothetical protein